MPIDCHWIWHPPVIVKYSMEYEIQLYFIKNNDQTLSIIRGYGITEMFCSVTEHKTICKIKIQAQAKFVYKLEWHASIKFHYLGSRKIKLKNTYLLKKN